MLDLKLDFDNKKLLNETIDKKDRVIQHIKTSVRSWLGDFYLDASFGVDYDNSWGDIRFIEISIRKQIKKIQGVQEIKNIEVIKSKDINQSTIYIVNVSILYNKEMIEISNLII